MILNKSTFKYLDRGKENLLVLVSGWASDWRIFSRLELDFNYLLADNYAPSNFEQLLLEAKEQYGIKKFSILGWSLGGFLAADFAGKHQSYIDRLILVSVRKKYQLKVLNQIKTYLAQNKEGYLRQFYHRCFAKDDNAAYFKQNLLSDYSQNFGLDYLLEGLDYLKIAQIDHNALKELKRIEIIHGQDDLIAPFAEAEELAKLMPWAKFTTLKQAGHIPFLRKDFDKYL